MTAQFSVAVKYGSNDDVEASGTAHFVEHMLAGGSQARIKTHHEVDMLGGCSYFETSNEATFTKVDVLQGRIVQASKVLLNLIFDPAFEREKFEIERKVILNEIAEAFDDPQDKTAENFVKNLFKRHPVRNPIAGTKKTVKKLELADVKASHQKQYVPENMIAILTGSFATSDKETIREELEELRGAPALPKNTQTAEKSLPRSQTIVQREGLAQAYLCFGLQTVQASHADVPVLDVINSVLGNGESSRLFVELREKRALTYDLGSANISGLDYGFFIIDCAVKTNAVNQAQNIIKNELTKIKNQQITDTELEKSKSLLIANYYRAIDSNQELPLILADSEIHHRDNRALQKYLDRVSRVSASDIVVVSGKYFREKNYAAAITTTKNRQNSKESVFEKLEKI